MNTANNSGVLDRADKLASQAKKSGVSYQDWISSWPGGAQPGRSGSPGLMRQIADVANEVHNKYYGLYDGGQRDGIDERGIPGFNDGYQIWIRLWPSDKEMRAPGKFSFGNGRNNARSNNGANSPNVRNPGNGIFNNNARSNGRAVSPRGNARFNNGAVSPRARRNSGNFSGSAFNGNF